MAGMRDIQTPPPLPLDNTRPRYLPHLDHPQVLQMGLSPLGRGYWIETDTSLPLYHRHKLAQRARLGDRVYRALPSSLPAQRELAARLRDHLCRDQAALYRIERDQLLCRLLPEPLALEDSPEPLWRCSLWLADDLVIMEPGEDGYLLSAASLCSPSHWHLQDKFGLPLRAIHDPIPGFHRALTPRIDRFFRHLRPEHPVVRYNWSLQDSDSLAEYPGEAAPVPEDAALFYRTERQSLVRLPATGAVAFTIRVYLHPLDQLVETAGALRALFAAIDATPAPLAAYKGFDRLAPALAGYRAMTA
jgi:hypothetical protein